MNLQGFQMGLGNSSTTRAALLNVLIASINIKVISILHRAASFRVTGFSDEFWEIKQRDS